MVNQIDEFQKESPYLDDVNYLIDMWNQMDMEFSSNRINDWSKYLPNSTNCLTWQDVRASHESDTPEVVIKGDNIYGMLIILLVSLGGALVVLSFLVFLPLARWSPVAKSQVHQVQDQNVKKMETAHIAWSDVASKALTDQKRPRKALK